MVALRLCKLLLLCVALSESKRINTKRLIKAVQDERMPAARPKFSALPLPVQVAQAKARETLEQMTHEERNQLLSGVAVRADSSQPEPGYYVGNTQPIPRLGVPALKLSDAANGFRPTELSQAGTSTCWPPLLALAASWDEALVATVAEAMAKEFRGKGANVLLGPSVNVHRVARNGRNFEYLSGEDPYLGARLVPAFVTAVQSQKVIATMKHFAMNEQETNRMTENSIVDEKTAWNLYYPPFEAGARVGAGAFMCSYNEVNGHYSCHNSKLLQQDLDTQMGFNGFVMSDWGANHGPDAMDVGLDMDMPGKMLGLVESPWSEAELNSPKREEAIDEAAFRVLTSIYQMRLDECGDKGKECCAPPNCTEQLHSNQTSDKHRRLARDAAAASSVLLKNDGGILPLNLKTVKKIAVLGSAAHTIMYYAGIGSGYVPMAVPVTPFDAIQAEAAANNVQVVEVLEADVAIVICGTGTTEGIDRSSLHLDDCDLPVAVTAAIKPTVVVALAPGEVVMPWKAMVPGILTLFMGGEGAGLAIADLIFGTTAPAGKLPVMMPESEEDTILPNIAHDVLYAEGMFTSYRNPLFKAAFPFGHGLTYTQFHLSEAVVLHPGDHSSCLIDIWVKCISLDVTNVGPRSGNEVVQVYFEFAPAAGMPSRILRNFHKTRTLRPNEVDQIVMGFTLRDLSVYQPNLGWVPQTNIKAHIGTSSANISSSVVF